MGTDAHGDAQVTVGDGNEVQGDTSVALHGVDGPVNLAIGDDNAQQAAEDNSETIEDSYNRDHSANDSFNEKFEDNDLFQQSTDTDLEEITIVGDLNDVDLDG